MCCPIEPAWYIPNVELGRDRVIKSTEAVGNSYCKSRTIKQNNSKGSPKSHDFTSTPKLT